MALIDMAEKIRSKRKERNYTQEKLAHILGLTPAAVSKWETGQAFPDISMLGPLAAALSTTADELLGYDADVSEEQAAELAACAQEAAAKGDAEGALAACEALLREYPASTNVALACAGALMEAAQAVQTAHDADRAHRALKRSIELFERCMLEGTSELREVTAFILAGQYILVGEPERAIEAARSIHLPQADPRIMESASLAAAGRLSEAEEIARVALAEKEDDAALLSEILKGIEKAKDQETGDGSN